MVTKGRGRAVCGIMSCVRRGRRGEGSVQMRAPRGALPSWASSVNTHRASDSHAASGGGGRVAAAANVHGSDRVE